MASINNHNQFTFYVPGYEQAKADLQQQITKAVEIEAEKIEDELVLDNQDIIMAVIKLRVELEYLLRKLLEKRLNVSDASKEIRYMSLLNMTKKFFVSYPDYKYLQTSFDYFREIGNAAAHAQQVPLFQAKEALEIGSKLKATL